MIVNDNIGFLKIIGSFGTVKLKIIKLLDFFLGSFLALLLPPKANSSPLPLSEIKKILIIRPGGIGDAVFILPFLRLINKDCPAMEVHVLCERRNCQVFFSQSHISNEIYCYDAIDSWPKILRNSYDVIIDTEQWHYLSALTAYLLKHKQNIGFATRSLRTKLFNHPIPYQNNAYEIDNFQSLFNAVGIAQMVINDINNSFHVSADHLHWARRLISENCVSIFLGASIPLRRLTKSQLLELIQYLISLRVDVVLLGGVDVAESAIELEQNIHDSRLRNYVGRISFAQSAAVIKKSKIFIGPDSGLMHLACAVGTPVIAIFGPGNLKKWAPRGDAHKVITENVECSPCTHFGYSLPTCHGSYHCMRNIKIENLKGIISKII